MFLEKVPFKLVLGSVFSFFFVLNAARVVLVSGSFGTCLAPYCSGADADGDGDGDSDGDNEYDYEYE